MQRRVSFLRLIRMSLVLALGGLCASLLVAETGSLFGHTRLQAESSRRCDRFTGVWRQATYPFAKPSAKPHANPELLFRHMEALADTEWMRGYASLDATRIEWLWTERFPALEINELFFEYDADDASAAAVLEGNAGWPVACVTAQRWQVLSAWKSSPPPRWHSALHVPQWLRAEPFDSKLRIERVFPYRIIWAGLAVDVVVFAPLIGAASYFVGVVVRARRRRAGRCPSCGYSRVGLEQVLPCPECGQRLR